ncbi:hypothetical protein KC963_00185 [Candidatus Saccharibacteria bacterium]|nr:hypothetical protein [Candidatus Saccharibacteria bacterium]MCA9337291.1 hypothetical protein [Candidatus Saccharibacteria bacterium]
MKQKDIIIIGIVIIVSGVASYFISNLLFAAPKDLQTEVEVVEPITAEFSTPDTRYFNANSIDPTLTITIGNDQNSQPFNQTNSN